LCPRISNSRPAGIREARATVKLTQQALAERARCSIAYVQLVEAGYVPGNIEASPAYRRVLDVLNKVAA
jgi:predicted transcriptional regulator